MILKYSKFIKTGEMPEPQDIASDAAQAFGKELINHASVSSSVEVGGSTIRFAVGALTDDELQVLFVSLDKLDKYMDNKAKHFDAATAIAAIRSAVFGAPEVKPKSKPTLLGINGKTLRRRNKTNRK